MREIINRAHITIRGPYWNGIIGLKNLKVVEKKNCLIVTRGIAQAPSVLVAKKLKFSGNNVTVLLDPGSSGTNLASKYFNNLGCNVVEIKILDNKVFNEDARSFIQAKINTEPIAFIFSGGSDLMHRSLLEIRKSFNNKILFACTNNSNICCGEGICGSCNRRLKDGHRIKACKAQIDPAEIMGGI